MTFGVPRISSSFQFVLVSLAVFHHIPGPGGKQTYHYINLLVCQKLFSSLKVCREESNKYTVNNSEATRKTQKFLNVFSEVLYVNFDACLSLTYLG